MLGRRGEQEKLHVGEEEELGLLRPNPKQRRFGLVFNFFFKSKHPKTMLFWDSFFLKKIRTPQNDVVLGFQI